MRKYNSFLSLSGCLLAIFFLAGRDAYAFYNNKILPHPKDKVKLDDPKRIEADKYLYKSVYSLFTDDRDSSKLFIMNSLRINPRNPAAYYQWFRIESAKENFKTARYAISAAYNLDSTNVYYILEYAKVTFDLEDYERSNKCFLQLEKIKPSHHGALEGQLNCAYYSGKMDLALTIINRINEKDEYNDIVFKYHYNILLSKKKELAYELAELYFKKSQSIIPAVALAQIYLEKDLAVSKYWLDKAEAINPNDEELLITKIEYCKKIKNQALRFSIVNNILRNTNFSPQNKLVVYQDLLYDQDFAKNYQAALDSIFHNEVILKDSYQFKYILCNWNIVMQIGSEPDQLLKKQISEFESDTALYKNVKEQFSKNIFMGESGYLLDMYTLMLGYSMARNKINEVKLYAKAALNLYSRNYIAYYYLGRVTSNEGRNVEAVYFLNKAIEFAGNNTSIKAMAFSILGDISANGGDFRSAFGFYENALVNNPDEISVLNNYAYYLAKNNQQLFRALELSKRAISEAPNNVSFLDTYAWILFKMEKFEQAIEEYKKIFQIEHTPHPEILEHYGDVLYKMGDVTNAKIYWQNAIQHGAKFNLSEKQR